MSDEEKHGSHGRHLHLLDACMNDSIVSIHLLFYSADDRGANGKGNEGSTRVSRAEQEDVSARPPIPGVHV